jgi:regulator of sirC expression with transglutaminase-like and TPR domain
MNALSVTTNTPQTPSEKQRSALIKLLADDDRGVYQTIRNKILSYGQESTHWLRPYALSGDPVLRRRTQEIIQHLARHEADNEFLAFCLTHGEELDVEAAVWLLAKTQYPDINLAAYQALLDSFAGELLERVDYRATAEKTLGTINDFLFSQLGFSGNEESLHDPDNSYLNRVVDRRTGNPISLCLIYILIARRLHLPVAGIGMPGHFLCRYQSATEEIFIDAFSKGKFLTKADCIKYLNTTGHGFQEDFLGPVSSRRILLRICSNLQRIYGDLGLAEETARAKRYILALSK